MNKSPENRQLETVAYSIPEACRVSSLGRTNLYNLINAGKLDARKVGGRTLIPAESLRRLIEQAPSALDAA
ncbi:helix-turn-helix domain-containing protein [Mesorhizobium sp. GR13]|uniref:helix-turn-helix domain-containing protein n=1 Tax=Mesorhizobium sp. GR13 TaxID=2562308 RepID=UPI0010BF7A64|nr:helix-turn-helix domain-containing protein [Mesorhizobium sp. GR13]